MPDFKQAKCVTLLTFDFDAESAQVRKSPHLPVSLSKGQFAPRVGIPRVLDLLDKYEIKATFFTPGWTAENYPEETRQITRRGHEIAAHGYLHENFSELTEDQEWEVHRKSVEIIETVVGKKPVGFRAPYWEWSTRTLDFIHKCGFRYDSSLMNDDKPYQIDQGISARLYELPVEWFLDDWSLFELQRQSPTMVLDAWRSEFDAVYDLGVGYFMLTMHPECIGRASRMNLLKQLIDHICEKSGTVFGRCDEYIEHISRLPQKLGSGKET
jgi:peptidoglycan/xylan/chitin deacetylase (PgdA/CDA1 family)